MRTKIMSEQDMNQIARQCLAIWVFFTMSMAVLWLWG